MHTDEKSVLILSMPFAGILIPSIQLPVLEGYLTCKGVSEIKTHHLYLKTAEIYGLKNYNYLIYPPNDSYAAQLIFSKYVFPEHWKKNEAKIKKYFDEIIIKNNTKKQLFSFEECIKSTDIFLEWIVKHTNWESYDFIGFTLNYGQFLPSLAFAKIIKEKRPDKKIIFGGSRTIETIGVNTLKAFPYIDFVVSGDGEEALYRLVTDYENHEKIPGLIYHKDNKIYWNQTESIVDINQLPVYSYDSFYEQVSTCSPEIQQFFQNYGRLPIEISRGCWWNQCTFCNQHVIQKKYREKDVNRVIEEVQFLSEKYKILDFQIIGNTLQKNAYNSFFEKIIQLGKDFNFVAEVRARQLSSTDHTLMKNAGFKIIQTGIESFSSNYLKKMNKGTRVIDNIAALKYCKENGIQNQYNLIIDYPNEEPVDFEETKKNIQSFKQYLDPPQLCRLRVVYGSPIQKNPDMFNIQTLKNASIDVLMFPKEILNNQISFLYDFTKQREYTTNQWEQLINNWREERAQREIEAVKTHTDIDRYIFYYVDGGTFLKIYDKRNQQELRIFVLDQIEREIFLGCIDVISYDQLSKQLVHIPDFKLAAILQTLESNGIIYREDKYYLSLPLQLKKLHQITKKEMLEPIAQLT